MDIDRLHPADADREKLWDMVVAAKQHDDPDNEKLFSRTHFMADIDNVNPETRFDWWLARVDGRIVGGALMAVTLVENQHIAFTDVTVHPDYRRRGIGTALLDTVTTAAREAGRTMLNTSASEPLPGGPRHTTDGRDFLLASGFRIVHTGRSRRVELSAIEGIEPDLLDDAWKHAEGYELVQWTGATPREHTPGAAALASRLLSDVPLGEHEFEDVTYDTERYLRKESTEMRYGYEFTCTYVRHVASGDLVAHSVIAVNRDMPQYGLQWITLVHPDHRGHRLGMIVKIENHRLLRRDRPEVRWIETSNAEVNSHMVAINEKLNFTELGRHLDFQREI